MGTSPTLLYLCIMENVEQNRVGVRVLSPSYHTPEHTMQLATEANFPQNSTISVLHLASDSCSKPAIRVFHGLMLMPETAGFEFDIKYSHCDSRCQMMHRSRSYLNI